MIMDTLLEALSRAVPAGEGLVRACAGDVASVLGRMSAVGAMAPMCNNMEAASGFALHSCEGVVVPLLQGASDRVRRRIARELRVCAPEWQDGRSCRPRGMAVGRAETRP